MSNSPLATYKLLSPNHSSKRTHKIDRITPHCVVGQLTAEQIASIFQNRSRQASCNYGIGKDGKIALIVDESNRSWCTSSNSNDQRAVTIEVASDRTTPYAFKEAAYQSLIDLCVDICKRNNLTKVIWFGDKEESLNYQPKDGECILTVHRWYANKACPGDWLYNRMGQFANAINSKLEEDEDMTDQTFDKMMEGWMARKGIQPPTFEQEAINWASENGIMKGYSADQFAPKKPITRGEVIVVLKRFFDKYIKK